MPRSSPPSKTSSTSYRPKTSIAPPPPALRNPNSTVGHPVPLLPTPTLGQSIKEGFGLGAGSAIAQRMVSAVFGPPTINTVNTSSTSGFAPAKEACEKERYAFETCMKTQSMETFCGQEQMAYTSCLQVSKPSAHQ